MGPLYYLSEKISWATWDIFCVTSRNEFNRWPEECFGQGRRSMKLKSLECILGNLGRFKGIMSVFSLKSFKLDYFGCRGNIFIDIHVSLTDLGLKCRFIVGTVISQISHISVHIYQVLTDNQLFWACSVIMCSVLSHKWWAVHSVGSVPPLEELTMYE